MSDHDDDQPPGFPGDGNPWLPPVHEAAERVLAFVAWFGDGEVVVEGAPYDEQPPLYARDLEAMAKPVATTNPYWFIQYRFRGIEWTRWARGTGEEAVKVALSEFREAKPAYEWRAVRCIAIAEVESW